MGNVRIVRGAEKEWREIAEEARGRPKPDGSKASVKTLLERAPGVLNMQRARYDPYHFVPPHSHSEDEVIYLLDGCLDLGNTRLDAGDTIYVPKETRYSLRAGAAGAEFLRVGLPT